MFFLVQIIFNVLQCKMGAVQNLYVTSSESNDLSICQCILITTLLSINVSEG